MLLVSASIRYCTIAALLCEDRGFLFRFEIEKVKSCQSIVHHEYRISIDIELAVWAHVVDTIIKFQVRASLIWGTHV